MSADKRTPSTDALETLGNIISPTEKRDAIHLAVDPAFSKQYLNPGDHVRIIAPGEVIRCGVGQGHGIVDPFLRRSVDPGEYFWLVVYPREITSLRHVWSHPAFADEPVAAPVVPYPMPNLAAQDTMPPPFRVPRPEKVRSLEDEAEAQSKQWLQNFADGHDITYDEVMSAAQDFLDHGEYLCDGGKFEGDYVPDEFWDHYQVVKKEKVDENDRGSFFTCSC